MTEINKILGLPRAHILTGNGEEHKEHNQKYDPIAGRVTHIEQPMPIPNNTTDIQTLVMRDIAHRREVGIERYGTALQINNGRDMLRDLYEEILDAAVYCRGLIEETNELEALHSEMKKCLNVMYGPIGASNVLVSERTRDRLIEICEEIVEKKKVLNGAAPGAATHADLEKILIPLESTNVFEPEPEPINPPLAFKCNNSRSGCCFVLRNHTNFCGHPFRIQCSSQGEFTEVE